MSSISVSDYRKACVEFIESAIQRPQMYFQSLHELETLLRGHETAFQQLDCISADDSFHVCFTDWLFKTKNVSGSAGWAHAIQTLLPDDGADPDVIFEELIRDFLSQWTA